MSHKCGICRITVVKTTERKAEINKITQRGAELYLDRSQSGSDGAEIHKTGLKPKYEPYTKTFVYLYTTERIPLPPTTLIREALPVYVESSFPHSCLVEQGCLDWRLRAPEK